MTPQAPGAPRSPYPRTRLRAGLRAGLCAVSAALLGQLPAQAQSPTPTTASTPASTPAAAAASLPPAEWFYDRADIQGSKLSPSGKWLALASRAGGQRTALVIFDLQTWKILAVVARLSDADVRSFYWVNDDMLVYDVTDSQAGLGDQRFGNGLFAVDRTGQRQRTLIRTRWEIEPSSGRLPARALSPAHDLLHVPAGGGDEVIVGEPQTTVTGQPTVMVAKRLNVLTGQISTLSHGLPDSVNSWWFDPDGRPKAVLSTIGQTERFYWRDADQDQWRLLQEAPRFNRPWSPRFVDATGTLWVTRSAGPDSTEELVRFDFQRNAPEAEAFVRTPGFDFQGGLVTEGAGTTALGLRVTTDARTTVWFDADMKAAQAEADRRLPGLVNTLTCRPCSGPDRVVLVHSHSDRHPGLTSVYWPAQQRWRVVGAARPRIDPNRMATTDMHRVRARDGLEFPVWVTRPAGAQGPLPTVVLVHGGPFLRGREWNWEADAQFLAVCALVSDRLAP